MLADWTGKLDELFKRKETVGSIEASVSMIPAQYDEILNAPNGQKVEMREVTSRLAEIEKKTSGGGGGEEAQGRTSRRAMAKP